MRNKKGIKAVLVGAAGYVAPRHMKAMKDLNIELVAALDPHDNVGILDRYFPDCEFFTYDRPFYKWCLEYNETDQQIDIVSICSPNYIHISHIKAAFGLGANVICEKPLVLHMDDYDQIRRWAASSDCSLYCVLQLREHPLVQLLKRGVVRNRPKEVEISYVAPRGKWYNRSWKGDYDRSGGLVYNIGVHMFDLMIYLFGNDVGYIKSGEINQHNFATGSVMLGGTDIGWLLTTSGQIAPCRSISFDKGPSMDLGKGVTELHTNVYQSIILNWGDEYDCLHNDSIYRGMKLTSLVSGEYQRRLRERGQ